MGRTMTSTMTKMDGARKKKGSQSCSRWRLGRIFQIVVSLPVICSIVICFSPIFPVRYSDMNAFQISDGMTARCEAGLAYERSGESLQQCSAGSECSRNYSRFSGGLAGLPLELNVTRAVWSGQQSVSSLSCSTPLQPLVDGPVQQRYPGPSGGPDRPG